MPQPNPLQLLQELGRSSAGFPDQLTEILLREDWMVRVQDLPRNDLEALVEYLDNVCVRIAFTQSSLSSIVGPQHSQPHQPRLLSLFVQTPGDLWCPQAIANISHALVPSFESEPQTGHIRNLGRYTRGVFQGFEGLR